MSKELDKKFTKAFDEVSKLRMNLPPDVRLQFYAFFKQATTGDNFSFNNESNVISAFKYNAWMQLNGMPAEEAKKKYIKLAKKILTKKKTS
ncbi:acyl-CoA-binding protein [Lutibacter sp. Hel_I_33_5]|uniref:acyl-CoA-binding protein n=1 Tax=Lutibacter sp. Hel_I_33_5 TaxID=1566289 RepID=UPI0011A38793|nr:acyl-CoA-binding protein [Lutibacter sp. Hel_I_33_5]TVZ57097.1 acyl-CoA-binding protein [Lutibacter sp. Hel_I_33_5]